MLDDAGALGLGDLARPVGRRRVDDEDLVEQRHAADHLAHRPADDRPDRLLLVERRQDEADRQALLLLERRRAGAGRRTRRGGSSTRRTSARPGPGRRAPPRRRGRRRPASRPARPAGRTSSRSIVSRVLTTMTVGLARAAIASGRAPNRYVSPSAPPGDAEAPMTTRSAFSASRRIALRTFGASRRTASLLARDVLLDERGEGALGLGADGEGDPGRDEVEDDRPSRRGGGRWRRRSAGRARRAGRRGPGRGSAGSSFEPRCLTTAMSHGESRTTSSIVGEKTVGPVPSRPPAALAAPAEDDEVGLLLGRGLDDALRGVAADPHDRVDRRPVRRVVEDALEEAPGVAGAGRALGQRHALGDLDDPERRQLAGPRVEHRRAEADELLGGHRVGDRDEDRGRGAAASAASCRLRRAVAVSSARRGTASAARTRGPGARRAPRPGRS